MSSNQVSILVLLSTAMALLGCDKRGTQSSVQAVSDGEMELDFFVGELDGASLDGETSLRLLSDEGEDEDGDEPTDEQLAIGKSTTETSRQEGRTPASMDQGAKQAGENVHSGTQDDTGKKETAKGEGELIDPSTIEIKGNSPAEDLETFTQQRQKANDHDRDTGACRDRNHARAKAREAAKEATGRDVHDTAEGAKQALNGAGGSVKRIGVKVSPTCVTNVMERGRDIIAAMHEKTPQAEGAHYYDTYCRKRVNPEKCTEMTNLCNANPNGTMCSGFLGAAKGVSPKGTADQSPRGVSQNSSGSTFNKRPTDAPDSLIFRSQADLDASHVGYDDAQKLCLGQNARQCDAIKRDKCGSAVQQNAHYCEAFYRALRKFANYSGSVPNFGSGAASAVQQTPPANKGSGSQTQTQTHTQSARKTIVGSCYQPAQSLCTMYFNNFFKQTTSATTAAGLVKDVCKVGENFSAGECNMANAVAMCDETDMSWVVYGHSSQPDSVSYNNAATVCRQRGGSISKLSR